MSFASLMIPRCGSFSTARASHSPLASASFIRSAADIATDVEIRNPKPSEARRVGDTGQFEIRDLEWLPFLLQTADALFPTGAYAHSLGFEESVRLGFVRDEASLRRFLLEQIIPAQ